jgi:hypothetical protein
MKTPRKIAASLSSFLQRYNELSTRLFSLPPSLELWEKVLSI